MLPVEPSDADCVCTGVSVVLPEELLEEPFWLVVWDEELDEPFFSVCICCSSLSETLPAPDIPAYPPIGCDELESDEPPELAFVFGEPEEAFDPELVAGLSCEFEFVPEEDSFELIPEFEAVPEFVVVFDEPEEALEPELVPEEEPEDPLVPLVGFS